MSNRQQPPKLTPEQEARRQLQNQLMTVFADELRAKVEVWARIFGADYETIIWGMWAAMLTTFAKCHPQNQVKVMEALFEQMDKRLQVYSGQRPPEPAGETGDSGSSAFEEEPEPEPESEVKAGAEVVAK